MTPFLLICIFSTTVAGHAYEQNNNGEEISIFKDLAFAQNAKKYIDATSAEENKAETQDIISDLGKAAIASKYDPDSFQELTGRPYNYDPTTISTYASYPRFNIDVDSTPVQNNGQERYFSKDSEGIVPNNSFNQRISDASSATSSQDERLARIPADDTTTKSPNCDNFKPSSVDISKLSLQSKMLTRFLQCYNGLNLLNKENRNLLSFYYTQGKNGNNQGRKRGHMKFYIGNFDDATRSQKINELTLHSRPPKKVKTRKRRKEARHKATKLVSQKSQIEVRENEGIDVNTLKELARMKDNGGDIDILSTNDHALLGYPEDFGIASESHKSSLENNAYETEEGSRASTNNLDTHEDNEISKDDTKSSEEKDTDESGEGSTRPTNDIGVLNDNSIIKDHNRINIGIDSYIQPIIRLHDGEQEKTVGHEAPEILKMQISKKFRYLEDKLTQQKMADRIFEFNQPNLHLRETSNVATQQTHDASETKHLNSMASFSYDPGSLLGPQSWQMLNQEWTCKGRKQSPINIDTQRVSDDQIVKNIILRAYPPDKPLTGILKNNGHAPTVTISEGVDVKLFGGTLSGHYFLKQFHFHFGCDSSLGSEHHIDGNSYPLELHLVFWDNTTYATFSEAAKSDRGIAVISILYTVTAASKSKTKKYPLAQFSKLLHHIEDEGDSIAVTKENNIKLENIVPNVMSLEHAVKFYTYEGSLSSPGCYETVTWIVYATHPPVTESQLQTFRKLKSSKANTMGLICNNFRPIQATNGRRIFSNIIE